MAQELEAHQRTALVGLGSATEPELDQFMVSFILSAHHRHLFYFLERKASFAQGSLSRGGLRPGS